jgi:hypothetical protein
MAEAAGFEEMSGQMGSDKPGSAENDTGTHTVYPSWRELPSMMFRAYV